MSTFWVEYLLWHSCSNLKLLALYEFLIFKKYLFKILETKMFDPKYTLACNYFTVISINLNF